MTSLTTSPDMATDAQSPPPAGGGVSFLRQVDMFDPMTFHNPCHVIGLGVAGSWVTEGLVRLGVPCVHVYDDDRVTAHNTPNQAYSPSHHGLLKVDATSARHAAFTGTEIVPHAERVGSAHRFAGVVFLCVDTMDARREIWTACIRDRPSVRLFAEVRLAAEEGRIYAFDPADVAHGAEWEAQSDYASGHAQEQACTYRAIVYTGWMLASLVTWHLARWHRAVNLHEDGVTVPHWIFFGLKDGTLLRSGRWG